jgi:hypothetical protein
MERRGVYRKGSAGHVRNVSMYRLYMQHAKRWKVPFTALLALFIVFSAAPIVGDEYQASLLSVPEKASFETSKPTEVKKVLIDAVKSFTDDCGRFQMQECESAGNKLINDIALAADQDVTKYVPVAEDFAAKYENEVALSACKFDLGNALVQLKTTQDTLNTFFDQYGETLNKNESDFAIANVSALNALVDSCENQLVK